MNVNLRENYLKLYPIIKFGIIAHVLPLIARVLLLTVEHVLPLIAHVVMLTAHCSY